MVCKGERGRGGQSQDLSLWERLNPFTNTQHLENVAPPSWPRGITPQLDNVCIDSSDQQKRIDERLAFLLKVAKGRTSMNKSMLEIVLANSIDDFFWIPDLLAGYPEMQKYVCPIQNRPIRHICKIESSDLFYERSALLQWCKGRKEEAPPGWPEGIAYKEAAIVDDPKRQQEINTSLESLWQEMKEELSCNGIRDELLCRE